MFWFGFNLPYSQTEWSDFSVETITIGDKKIGIRTSVLEEKATACNMLCCYADELKEGFYPWIDQVQDTLPFLRTFGSFPGSLNQHIVYVSERTAVILKLYSNNRFLRKWGVPMPFKVNLNYFRVFNCLLYLLALSGCSYPSSPVEILLSWGSSEGSCVRLVLGAFYVDVCGLHFAQRNSHLAMEDSKRTAHPELTLFRRSYVFFFTSFSSSMNYVVLTRLCLFSHARAAAFW